MTLWWFLPYFDMNQPREYIVPHPEHPCPPPSPPYPSGMQDGKRDTDVKNRLLDYVMSFFLSLFVWLLLESNNYSWFPIQGSNLCPCIGG